ncbi:Dynein light chain type 1 family protein [Leishmania donovani]|uniref:Dynein light chain type 1 family protein n=1 Tax=Leishmania donovani TaxID=5661 RepID=A0A504X8V9_LEIDO|nr:Dynein light chain type 1 family protein [Leishmania donovani]
MDIDLRDRGIARLCFDAQGANKEEATVASAVAVLLADHNRIDCISGLNAVFVNLVELRLSHNQLGRLSTPYHRLRQTCLRDHAVASRCCDGVASWIRCLPTTLQVIDVAFNNLHSFLECSCECAAAPERHAAADVLEVKPSVSDATVSLARLLRHRVPFALPLFFSAQRFPQLRELKLSHNAFDVSLRESDEMQDGHNALQAALLEHSITATAPTTLSSVDLSYNGGLASLNCFFLSIPPCTGASAKAAAAAAASQSTDTPSCSVSLAGTGIEDLQGISSVNGHGAAVQWDLQLHPSPVSLIILRAAPSALLQLTHAIVNMRVDGEQNALAAALTEVTHEGGTATSAIAGLQSVAQLDDLEQIAAAAILREEPDMSNALPDGATWISTLAYACLLRQVVPSLRTLDRVFRVERCEQLLLSAPAALTVPVQRGLGGAAHCVAPELQSRIVVGTEASEAAEPPVEEGTAVSGSSDAVPFMSGEDWYAPSGLTPGEGALYESLCQEAKELQEAVLASNERCRDIQAHTEALQQQLRQDRTLVADQWKEIGRLRQEKEHLEASVGRAKHRLDKRQKEVTYGVTAMQSREVAAREKAAMERIAAREKELERRERQLRQRAARSGTLAVEYQSSGPSGQRKKLRSEVLREAAVRKRMAEQENKDPLAYSPAPFKAEMHRCSPRRSPDQRPSTHTAAEEEHDYFELYGDGGTPELREVADQYLAHLPLAQQQQLRQASLRLPYSGSFDESRGRSRQASPSQRRGSPTSGDGGDPVVGYAAETDAKNRAPSPEAARDLSSLSLSELLDAAAAIRQKQVALQRLQHQWQRSLPPPMLSPGGEEATHAMDTVVQTAFEKAPSLHSRASRGGADDGDASAGSVPNSAQQLFDRMLEQRASAATHLMAVNTSAKAVAGDRTTHATVKNADMPEDMQADAIEVTLQAMEKFNIEKDIAAYIKKEFDKKYQPTWHCIVGRNFGSFVTHDTHCFLYFYLGQVAVLLFKCG